MKSKVVLGVVSMALVAVSATSFARGYMGGNQGYSQQSTNVQENRGYGDQTMPRPMDGSGFGAKNHGKRGNGRGLRLRDGSCLNDNSTNSGAPAAVNQD